MRVRRLAAGTAALLLPFAACSDGESNADPVEPTSSAAPSPSENTPEGPTLPPEAQGDDEAAAKAFVEFYFELISDAITEGETAALKRHSSPRCESCRGFAARIDEIAAEGSRFETQRDWQIKSLIRDPVDERSQRAFYARVDMPRQRVVNAEGEVTAVDKPRIQGMRVLVERRGQTWTMLRMDLLT